MLSIVKIDWTESEQGWGQRPDGTSLHANMEEANRYIEEFWKEEKERNPSGRVPECYSRPETPELIFVDDILAAFIHTEGSWWVTSTRWWKSGDEYTIPPRPTETITKEPEMTQKPIEEYSIEELLALVEKKKKLPPPVIKEPDFDKVKEEVEEYINQIAKTGITSDDYKENIFQLTVEAIYGRNIWTWYNSVVR